MASTFSPLLRTELPANGDQPGSWGTTVNTNVGTLLEQAIAGSLSIAMADADLTLTASNGVTDQARYASLLLTGGALTVTRNVIIPNSQKGYIVYNNTTSGQSIVVKTAAGAGVTIPNGYGCQVICDGANSTSQRTPFYSAVTNAVSLGSLLVSGAVTVSGASTLSGTTTVPTPRSVGTGRPLVTTTNVFGVWNWNSGGVYVDVDVSGVAYGINVFVSDLRLKTDVAPASQSALDKLSQLHFIDFRYRPTADGEIGPLQHGGIIAQQAQAIDPAWVHVGSDEQGTLTLNAPLLLTNAIQAVTELNDRLIELEAKLAALGV
jgi:hypothetical protein